jgi:hypothetical protein
MLMVLGKKGYRFFDPLRLEFNDGFGDHELSEIHRMIEAHMDELHAAWHKSFGSQG